MTRSEKNAVDIPAGWKVETNPSASLVARILESYAPAIRDSLGVGGFLNALLSSPLLVHETAWVLVDRVVPGGAIFVHGGKFADGNEHVEPFRELLAWLLETSGTSVVVAPVPEKSPASLLLSRVGFVKTGFVPLDDSYGGEVRSTEIWTLFPTKQEESDEEDEE